MAAWSLCEFLAWNMAAGPNLTLLYRIEGIFWIPIGFLILHFAYILLQRPADLVLWISGLLAHFFVALEFTGDAMVASSHASFYGNKAVYGWAQLPATLCSAGSAFIALLLILRRAFRVRHAPQRPMLSWFTFGIATTLGVSVVTEILVPNFFPALPWIELGPSSTSLTSCFTFVAIIRHRFLSPSVEDFAEGLFNSLAEGVLITDERFIIRKANPAAEQLFGGQKLEGLDADGLLPGLSSAPSHWEKGLGGRPGVERRHLIVGSAPFSAFGAHHWRFVFLVDNTAMVRAQEALTESERRFRETVDLVPTAIVEVDPQGNILTANRTAFSMFGYEMADLERGLNCFRDILRPEEHERARANFADILQKKRVGASEYGLRRKDGAPLHGLLLSTPRLADGRLVGLRTCISDITEIDAMRGVLQRSQRLESLGILAGGIAHDFNNILTSILGGVTLLKELPTGESPASQRARVMEQVEKAALRASSLTRQLLTFSKGGNPMKAAHSPLELLREGADLAFLGSSVRFTCDAPPSLPLVDVDKDQLLQVFHNILLNAVQAMPAGGEVHVALDEIEGRPGGAPGAGVRAVRFLIDDSGPGIPEAILPKIFDPYFTTKATGTGLGLSTSHSIIQRHGGSLATSKSPLGGARFEITLPVHQGTPVPAAELREEVAIGRHAHILIMDDDPLILNLLTAMLENMGHRVSVAHDGEEARPEVELCILDLTIPGGMGGEETMRRLREQRPDLKALVSSGYSDAPILSDPASYGFLDILPKPYSYQGLQAKLGKILG
jgi:PAS domain S-box-containing protein